MSTRCLPAVPLLPLLALVVSSVARRWRRRGECTEFGRRPSMDIMHKANNNYFAVRHVQLACTTDATNNELLNKKDLDISWCKVHGTSTGLKNLKETSTTSDQHDWFQKTTIGQHAPRPIMGHLPPAQFTAIFILAQSSFVSSLRRRLKGFSS